MDSHAAEIVDLRAEADELERKITALLSKPSGGQDALMHRWGINKTQARILGTLADGCIYSIAEIAAICSRSGAGNIGTARCEIHRLRQKIKPIQIRSIYGRGLRLDEPHLSTVLDVMGGQS